MPNIWTAVDANFPTLNDEDTAKEQIRRMVNYMSLLTEQLKYTLQNLDSSNWNPTALAEENEETAGTIAEAVEQLQAQIKEVDLTEGGTVNGSLKVSGTMDADTVKGTAETFKKLWENPDVSATFAAQMVDIDLSECEWVLIETLGKVNMTGECIYTMAKMGDTVQIIGITLDSSYTWGRSATVAEGGITFSNAGRPGDKSTSYNSYVIPYRVYGMKVKEEETE